jgi:hypothetical protein
MDLFHSILDHRDLGMKQRKQNGYEERLRDVEVVTAESNRRQYSDDRLR